MSDPISGAPPRVKLRGFPRKSVGCKVFLARFLFLIVLVGGGFIYWLSNTHWIEAGYVGVIYDASGGLRKEVYPPQRLFVGWRQQLYTYPTKPQNAVYSQNADEGEVKAADGILITTSDNANTTFDIAVIYRVLPENVITVFNTFGPIDIGQIQTNHIRRAVRDGANNVGSKYSIFQLVGQSREEASNKLTKELQARLGPKGITVEAALILRAYLTNETQARVNASINSITQIGISQLENQVAQVNSQAAVVQAEAQQKARTIAASKTQGKSLEMLSLDLESQAIAKWNGKLSPIQPQPGQTIVIGGSPLTAAAAPRNR